MADNNEDELVDYDEEEVCFIPHELPNFADLPICRCDTSFGSACCCMRSNREMIVSQQKSIFSFLHQLFENERR